MILGVTVAISCACFPPDSVEKVRFSAVLRRCFTSPVMGGRTMIDRAWDRFDLWLERRIAETGYGSAVMLNWLVH